MIENDEEDLRTKLDKVLNFSNDRHNKPEAIYYIESEDDELKNDWPFCQEYNIYKVNNYYGVVEIDKNDRSFKEATTISEEGQSLEEFLNSIDVPTIFPVWRIKVVPSENVILDKSKLHNIFYVCDKGIAL